MTSHDDSKKVPYLHSIFNIYLPSERVREEEARRMENKRNEIVYESEINKIMLNKRTRKRKCIRKRAASHE
jgi:hypothetical protein